MTRPRTTFILLLWSIAWLLICTPAAFAAGSASRISSFETDAEAALFLYDGGDKGRASVSEEYASHGNRSLKVEFRAAEWEIRKHGVGLFAYRLLHRLGIVGKDDPGKLALLGAETDTLPFDWQDIEAFAFDVFNPSEQARTLTLQVLSGLFRWDPTARTYRTRVELPPHRWTVVRLTPETMGDALHPDGVLELRLFLPETGTLYLDDVRLIMPFLPNPRPRLVRLSWTADPRTTQNITWQSFSDIGQVRFGPAGGPLQRQTQSEASRIPGWPHGFLHEALLSGLEPDREYEYQLCSGDGDWGPKRRFRTAPDSGEAQFEFLAGSDTKGSRDVLIELLKRSLEGGDPRFLIYVGDGPHEGGRAGQWERWFQALQPFASEHPVMHAVGNHETGGDPELVNYRAFQTLPGKEAYYSFDYGAVHFSCLDTDSGQYPEQLAWLEADLSQTDRPWKVVFFHTPLFSSDAAHGSDEVLQKLLGPILTRYGVQLVVNGHGHLYERSRPIRFTGSKATLTSSYAEGTCYVVSGGAGAGLYEGKRGNWWTAALKSEHHLCRIRVSGSERMRLEAVNLQGEVFDEVEIVQRQVRH